MQDDRYDANKVLYLTGMISLIVALALFMFASYLFAYLFFGLVYDVPGFVVAMQDSIGDTWNFTPFQTNLIIFCLYFVPSVFLGWLSYWTSNRIDSELPSITDEANKSKLQSIPIDFVVHLGRFVASIIGVAIIVYLIRWMFFI
ncbi:MAG: hypothetical protein A3F18_05445 [Legionellales bacterium RIFCSPHIGHO2_12_FULL_37_14]|nr:MAG: hypothetical protein A3F18_05445 [Legionellales bacterium RIFCSPHIGHO2_12_FULL_37_14]